MSANVKVIGADATTTTAALATGLVVVTGPAKLFKINFLNTNAAARWLQIFDAIALPADTAVPLISIPVAIGAAISESWVDGRPFKVGICICNSTTAATKTIGSADSLIDACFRKTTA